jgi:hypothetical protein
MPLRNINWGPLTMEVSERERNLHKSKYLLETSIPLQLLLVFGMIMIITGIIIFFSVEDVKNGLIVGGSLVFIGVLPVWLWLWRERESRVISTRLQQFAHANGFKYEKRSTHNSSGIEPRFASSALVDWRVVTGVYRGRGFSFGTHSEALGGSDNVWTQRLGFFKVQLLELQPRTVLIRKTKINKWPQNLKRLPEMRSGFYGKFKVYGGPESRNALEKILTPNLKAGILAAHPALDIELKDDYMYFYCRNEFPTSRKNIECFFNLVDSLP